MKQTAWWLAFLMCIVVVAGCAYSSKSLRRASVVDYLYPKKAEPVDVPGPTVMTIPIKVGIAFVPEKQASRESDSYWTYGGSADPFPERDKLELLQQVSTNFLKYPFVKSVELIPTQYLAPGGGFDNLDQIRTMFGVDVIALLSYDQVQFTHEGFWTITYWTIVGAYVVQGERNETATMIDAAVYHIPNRKLLFRAPGTSRVKGSATPINLSEELRANSGTGFQQAATNLVANLETQLAGFKEKIKAQPEEYQVVKRPGYTGTGALDGAWLALVAAAAVAARRVGGR